MTTDNKQSAMADAKHIAHQLWDDAIASDYEGFEAKVIEALSKLRGAGEPSDEEIDDLIYKFWDRDPKKLYDAFRALFSAYAAPQAITSGHNAKAPDTSSGHSEPVAEVQLHPHDASKAIVVALVDFEVVDVGMQLYAAPQASAEVRNAALEEAARRIDICNWLADDGDVPGLIARSIRALKSAPAAEGVDQQSSNRPEIRARAYGTGVDVSKPLDGEFAEVLSEKFADLCVRPAEDSAKGAGDDDITPEAHLMAEANKYWKYANAKHRGAVQWIENNETDELLIFTRGEYRETLLRNIASTALRQLSGEDLPLNLTWTDKQGQRHLVTFDGAVTLLRKFYAKWPGGWEEIEAKKTRQQRGGDSKRRPYNASGSLSEYGVFPECDAAPAASAAPSDCDNLAHELDGVIADVEQGDGFDEVCLETLKRVRAALLSRYGRPAGDAQQESDDDSIALDKLADYIADTWPMDKKYSLEEICQRLHAMWPGEFLSPADLEKNDPNIREALRALLLWWARFQASDGNQQDAYNLLVKGARLAWQFASVEMERTAPVAAQKADDARDALRRLVDEKFSSGNAIPVERITITRQEYAAIAQKVKP